MSDTDSSELHFAQCDCNKSDLSEDYIFSCDICDYTYCKKCKIECDYNCCDYDKCPNCNMTIDSFEFGKICGMCFYGELEFGALSYCKTCKNFVFIGDCHDESHDITKNKKHVIKKAIKIYPKLKKIFDL
jgi:hypothetical protein